MANKRRAQIASKVVVFAADTFVDVQRAISDLTSIASAFWPRRVFAGISLPISNRRLRVVSSLSA
jgi:hypothetical protein